MMQQVYIVAIVGLKAGFNPAGSVNVVAVQVELTAEFGQYSWFLY
jgi:hypothetical protein